MMFSRTDSKSPSPSALSFCGTTVPPFLIGKANFHRLITSSENIFEVIHFDQFSLGYGGILSPEISKNGCYWFAVISVEREAALWEFRINYQR